MKEFVPPVRIVCPWKLWAPLLKWEQAEIALQHSLTVADLDKTLIKTANVAFGASGENTYLEDFRGYIRAQDVHALERVAKRAGWPPDQNYSVGLILWHHDIQAHVLPAASPEPALQLLAAAYSNGGEQRRPVPWPRSPVADVRTSRGHGSCHLRRR